MGICRYETERSLRAAIFGEILLCRDRLTHDKVVVKTVDLQLALQQTSCSQEQVQENVLHEVEVLNRVRTLGGHPNVINMHSYFVAKGGGVLHMVLDYCEGGDLLDACVQPATADSLDKKNSDEDEEAQGNQQEAGAQSLPVSIDNSTVLINGVDGSKRLPECVAHTYLVDVLSGLRFLHSHGIAHRDVSLENILLRNGRAVIADFGLCVQAGSSPSGSFLCDETVGKHYYMAPEIVARERYDPRKADIWSVGIAFFILLTSSPPFERADPCDPGFRYVAKRGVKAVFSAWGLGQEVSEPMQDLLARMLSMDPEDRISIDEIWQHPVLLQRQMVKLRQMEVELVEVTKKTRAAWLMQAVRLERKCFSKNDSLGERLVQEAMKPHNTLVLAVGTQDEAVLGATLLVLEADTDNVGAIALYTSQGFKRTTIRIDYYRAGRDALLMELRL
ncbi:hypothetical protein BBJ29_001358 [Phytophthora kernoviae]|uniref:Protein kinase domain-containing protein n=1 Tax=Phytophthora kernoviae TaxID=325452 RepID=A0A3F2RV27_9STRA|nr:hypothetical protein BBJ29_001358 [Phytophthora kernoviae]RLN64300.1 hypothetical protein BBP00_00003559 [Phytophthora kernoviae]